MARAVTALLVFAVVLVVSAVSVPKWPAQYTVKGTFHLPLAVNGGVKEPVTFIYDAQNNRVRMEYYHGEDVTMIRYDSGFAYEIVPRVDKMTCYAGPAGDPLPLPTVLPDLSTWTYSGIEHILGVKALAFQTTVASPTPSNYTSSYSFYVDATSGKPVRFDMKGHNMIWSAHPDLYSFVFEDYQPNVAPANVFTPPSLCNTSQLPNIRRVYRRQARLAYFDALHPVHSDDGFDHFAVKHHKRYMSHSEREQRRAIWRTNMALINAHNSDPNKSTKLAINQFGDLTAEERVALFGISVQGSGNAMKTHVYDPNTPIPASIDWRKKGAVTEVKDQGVCGSCWTFGSAAAFEGAYAIKYGKLVEFSEQQLVDCAYFGGNQGCDGGNAWFAYDYLLSMNGLATETAYPYRMQDSFCKKVKEGTQIKGYVNVTSGDEQALAQAVATVGPVTVAINTKDPVWYYHTGSGVYDSDNCPGTVDDLDHQVTVVGYGTQDGVDYWLVKNSYSPFWGDKGFIKMRRNHNNLCGIATTPNYVIF